jgi:hypothetical protein
VRTHAQKYFQRLARISASESNAAKRRGVVGRASSVETTDDSGAHRGEGCGGSEQTEQSSAISSPRGGGE